MYNVSIQKRVITFTETRILFWREGECTMWKYKNTSEIEENFNVYIRNKIINVCQISH